MIDPNKPHRTKHGWEWKFYEQDGDNLIGAVRKAPRADWYPGAWDAESGCLQLLAGALITLPMETRDYDLIPLPDWRDEIPWEAIRPNFRWIAKQPTGGWSAHRSEPYIDSHVLWTSEGGWLGVDALVMPAGPDDWREAIAERPEGR